MQAIIDKEQRLRDAEIIMDKQKPFWKYLILALVVLLIGGGIVWKWYVQPKIQEVNQNLGKQDSLSAKIDSIPNAGDFLTTPTTEVDVDSFPSHYYDFNLTELEDEPIPLTTKGELLEEDISHLKANYWHLYGFWIKWISILLALAGFGLYELLRWKRRKLILVKEELAEKPHHFHHIRLSHPDLRLFQSEEFYETAKAFRRRVASKDARLDVEKSLKTTIEEGGYPSFAYREGTRAPEYLVLIDQPHIKSHQTRLFEQWVKELQQQDIFIERFFYRSDPRVCWKNAFEDDVYLEELANRYPNHRLLIFGDAQAFVNPQNDELREWVTLFEAWEEKAILSPKPTQWWTYSEIALAASFLVLPAQPAALARLIGIFEGEDDGNLGQWLDLEELDAPPIFDAKPTSDLLSSRHKLSQKEKLHDNSPFGRDWEWVKISLQSYLSPQSYQWLCACAVYPELHWDFTLQLGKALNLIGDHKLNQITHLLQLSRLPWLQTGRMPDELRIALIQDLNRETEEVVKKEIVGLMEKEDTSTPIIKPLANVFAAYEMLLVVKKWEWKDFLNKYRRIHSTTQTPQESNKFDDTEDTHSKEYSVLQSIDPTEKVDLGFQLPVFLRKVFYKSGMPMLGVKMGVRIGIVLFLFALMGFFIPQPEPDCLKPYNQQSYYLKDSVTTAQFYAYGALDTLRKSSLNNQKWENFIEALDRVTQKHPHSKAHYNRAFAHYQIKDYSEASQDWREFASIEKGKSTLEALADSLFYNALFNAGVAAYTDSTYEDALTYFDELLQKDSTIAETDYVKALTFLRLNEIDSLLTGLERIEVIDSNYLQKDSPLVTPLGRLYQRTNDENLKNRVGNLLLAMQVNIGDLDRQIQLATLKTNADALFKKERYVQAKSFYERMLRLQPDTTLLVHVNARIGTCDVKIEANKQKTAVQELTKLIAEADQLFADRQWEAAKNKYKEALEKASDESKLQAKIKACDEELAKLSEQERVQQKIAYADELFDNEDYDKAIKAYQSAQSDGYATSEQKNYVEARIEMAKSLQTFEQVIQVIDFDTKKGIADVSVELKDESISAAIQTTTKDGKVIFKLKGTFFLDSIDIMLSAKNYETVNRTVQLKSYGTPNGYETEKQIIKLKAKSIEKIALTEMIFVKGGTFKMGSRKGNKDEKPVHEVSLFDFYIDKHEVTNAQYAQFLNEYGSDMVKNGEFKGQKMIYEHKWGVRFKNGRWQAQVGYENHPMTSVNWYGANEYAQFHGKRLPTEAEWEYAAKGGELSKGYTYSGSNKVDDVAWYRDNSNRQTHEVMTKKANELGIYDMSGNVWEWCADWYDADYYKNSPRQNPQGSSRVAYRVLRGGSWVNYNSLCRSSYRFRDYPNNWYYNGFRLARTP